MTVVCVKLELIVTDGRTPPMSRYPLLEESLRAWLGAVRRFLRTVKPSDETLIVSSTEDWQLDSDGSFRPHRDAVFWHPTVTDQLKSLPEWSAVEAATARYPRVMEHLDTLVGTSSSLMRWDLDRLATAVIPAGMLRPDGSIRLHTPEPFGKRYRRLEHFLSGATVTITVIWPLAGITLAQKSLTLAPHIVIRRLTRAEAGRLLGLHLIPVRHGYHIPLVAEMDARPFALVARFSVPKVIGEVIDPDMSRFEAHENLKQQMIEDLQAAAAVVGIPNLGVGSEIEIGDWYEGWVKFRGAPSSGPAILNPQPVPTAEGRLLKEVWQYLSPRSQVSAAVALAARRLAFVGEKLRPEDRILDLMIAAEALYLKDAGSAQDRGELRHRLALRAASWDRSPQPKAEVHQIMKKAYDARSAVSHGGTPERRTLTWQGDRITLQQLIALARPVVQRGLLRAIRGQARSRDSFPPDWDAMILRRL